jgi:GntR family transcriptional regulator/MocR family aminotransferase
MAIHEARLLTLDPAPGETLRAALERRLRDSIQRGALREGARLPGSRAFARDLGVSRGVVSDAYAQLEAQGFLVARSRAVPVVAGIPRRGATHTEPAARPAQARYDLTPTTPDVTLFPVSRWLAAMQHVARRSGPATFDYRDTRGELALREALADHLGRTRGVIADPAQIVVVQGTAQGVDLLLRVLRARGGSRVAVEDPSHATQPLRIRALQMEVVAQPVDAEGLTVDGLRADAVLVTPAHQFPTGCVLSGERRRRLLAWSRETGGLIVEDDYDSEFRYDREPVRALQGIAPEQVVHLGTVSKTLAPALRLGWVVVPNGLADDAERTKRLLDDFSPALDQLALAELLTRGDYDRHVRHARRIYRARRDRLLTALSTHLPELAVDGIAAGMHLVLRLPTGVDDAAVAREAGVASIRVPALSAFRIARSGPGGLVVGYGRLHEAAVEPATRALAHVIRAHLASSPRSP